MFDKHVQGITFTHLKKSNDARLYKENKNLKNNVFIHNESNIYIRKLYQQMKKIKENMIILKSIIK